MHIPIIYFLEYYVLRTNCQTQRGLRYISSLTMAPCLYRVSYHGASPLSAACLSPNLANFSSFVLPQGLTALPGLDCPASQGQSEGSFVHRSYRQFLLSWSWASLRLGCASWSSASAQLEQSKVVKNLGGPVVSHYQTERHQTDHVWSCLDREHVWSCLDCEHVWSCSEWTCPILFRVNTEHDPSWSEWTCLILSVLNMSDLVWPEHVWSRSERTCLFLFRANMSILVQSEHVWSCSEQTCLILFPCS